MLNTIEDIILSKDGRGISNLRDSLSKDYCNQAAKFVLKNKGVVMITTGFYIAKARASETDGPPGAIAIGNALDQLGYTVIYVSDKYTVNIYIIRAVFIWLLLLSGGLFLVVYFCGLILPSK